MKLSRRSLFALTAVALAQTATPPPATPADRLEKARADNLKSAEKLTQFQIPMSTEPALQFRA
jgi:hypothetical protein